MADKQLVRDKIDQKTDLALLGGIGLVQHNAVSYHPNRAFTSLGCQSQKSLQDYLRKVANFVQLAKHTDDWPVLEMKIDSYALRRKLSQELLNHYKDRNLIFTQFSKGSPMFTVRKWKAKSDPQEESKDNLRCEYKVSEQEMELSAFDKIIQGDRKSIKVHFEDEKCLAFDDYAPVAKSHFIVLAKDTKVALSDSKDEALIGHLMVVASKVAKLLKLEEGYRVVVNNGRNAA